MKDELHDVCLFSDLCDHCIHCEHFCPLDGSEDCYGISDEDLRNRFLQFFDEWNEYLSENEN